MFLIFPGYFPGFSATGGGGLRVRNEGEEGPGRSGEGRGRRAEGRRRQRKEERGKGEGKRGLQRLFCLHPDLVSPEGRNYAQNEHPLFPGFA